NSLFKSNYEQGDNSNKYSKVTIANIRHLQNLDPEISGLPVEKVTNPVGSTPKVLRLVESAEQTADLDWEGDCELFKTDAILKLNTQNTWTSRSIYSTNGEIETTTGAFAGVINGRLISYNGQDYKISNFVLGARSYGAGSNKYSGIFPVIGLNKDIAVSISNLELIDTKAVENTTASGTLIGSMYGSGPNDSTTKPTISNIGVYVSNGKYKADPGPNTRNVHSKEGNVGGLIGQIDVRDGDNTSLQVVIENCFASVPVQTETGNAGGLIGSISRANTLITNSYSGGYTEEGVYAETSYNVAATGTAKGKAGGLVGSVSGTGSTIQNSFSTCSTYGMIAGGLIGEDSTNTEPTATTYTNCYSVGKATKRNETVKAGTFAGKMNAAKISNCYYLNGISGGIGSVGDGEAVNGSAIKAKNSRTLPQSEFSDTGNGSKPQYDSDLAKYIVETHNYDSAWNAVSYPFPTVNKTAQDKKTANQAVNQGSNPTEVSGVYYGDWSVVDFDAQLAYYEIYQKEGKYSLGLYNQTMNINSLIEDPDKNAFDIIQDGYILLSSDPDKAKISVNEAEEAVDSHVISDIKSEDGQDSLSIVPRKALEGSASLVWNNGGTTLTGNDSLTDNSVLMIGEDSYYLRFWDLLSVDAISSSTNYYSKVTASLNGTDCYFYCNPHYAMSAIQKCDEENEAINAEKMPGSTDIGNESNPVLIRTERQYSMMTQDLQNPSDDSNT
ncbi:MAG: hypothetical protein Q4B70_18390, partial [Lachnospiraceae bacterium]|nr:hypothetical protein [Lachnospiraceae bacterium]